MAGFEIAYDWMMDNEDSARAYAIVSDDPPGAHAISGINSAKFPILYEYVAALPQSQRWSAVKDFYQKEFWNNWFMELVSDELAKRVFDEAVNAGEGTAVKQLQIAINNVSGGSVTVDGGWGPLTLQAANLCDGAMLCAAFKAARAQHYRDIAAANPAEAQYLQAWLARAAK